MSTEDTPAGDPEVAPRPADKNLNGDLVARRARYYRATRYLLTAALILYGVWSIRDGFVKWPKENEDRRRAGIDKPAHTDVDVMINKVLGVLLPPAGVALLVWTRYHSRGEYRLAGDAVSVPGHPPVPLDRIESVDKERWDRKGIAVVRYRLPDGLASAFTLDDFVYDQQPTDAIFKRIEEALQAPRAPKVAAIPAAPKFRTPPRPRL